MPKIRETIVQDMVNPMIEDTKQLISKIDEYDEQSRDLDSKFANLNK